MKTLTELKDLFLRSDIKICYDTDCGQDYSYLEGAPDYSHLSDKELAEFEEFMEEWKMDND